MREQEKRVREQRTIEAVRKNLMGLSGKFGCILRYMGSPVEHHGGGLHDEIEFRVPGDDFWDCADDGVMPTLDEDYSSYTTGWIFDGTTLGVHVEIRYDESTHQLAVRFKGHLVYLEVRGELEAYLPDDEWEGKIDAFHARAAARERIVRKNEHFQQKKDAEKEKMTFLERLREKWGI